jgi:hypothetical protein
MPPRARHEAAQLRLPGGLRSVVISNATAPRSAGAESECALAEAAPAWQRAQDSNIGTKHIARHAGTESEGALYVFPQLHLPDGAHKAASESGVAPDMLYCKQLLEGTGIVAIPGSGFKQKEARLWLACNRGDDCSCVVLAACALLCMRRHLLCAPARAAAAALPTFGSSMCTSAPSTRLTTGVAPERAQRRRNLATVCRARSTCG